MSTSTATRVLDDRQSATSARPWTLRAACVGKTWLFFGSASERPEARVVRELGASLICSGCPVIAPCRSWAREHGEYGYWGGESEEMRTAAGFQARLASAVRQPRRLATQPVA
jgi:WhiB family transcriptional regulator, redox-sensing transcriptional regulator